MQVKDGKSYWDWILCLDQKRNFLPVPDVSAVGLEDKVLFSAVTLEEPSWRRTFSETRVPGRGDSF